MNLAQQGEIDPWDVQVIEIIDRFLEELGLLGETPQYLEADLPQSGQAFLWASMLVLLKAKTLEAEEAEEDELEPILEEEHSRPVALESRLRRRTAAPPVRKRRVTLQELIEQIEQLAATINEEAPGRRPPRPRPQSRRDATRTITGLAHNENLTEVATQLEHFLRLNSSRLAQTSVELEQLLEWWTQATALNEQSLAKTFTSNSQDRVGVFWALLLLSAQSKVELEQTEFYQDLKITLLSGHPEEE